MADKGSEVEIPGAVEYPKVRINAFTENTVILYAIIILSRVAISISSLAGWDAGFFSHTGAFHTGTLPDSDLGRASRMTFAGSMNKYGKDTDIVSLVTSRNSYRLLEVPSKRKESGLCYS